MPAVVYAEWVVYVPWILERMTDTLRDPILHSGQREGQEMLGFREKRLILFPLKGCSVCSKAQRLCQHTGAIHLWTVRRTSVAVIGHPHGLRERQRLPGPSS